MAKIERFEDLIAWQKARLLAQQVYTMTRLQKFRTDFALTNQIRRAAISIMSNIAEGFERNCLTEFHQFLSVAKASCAEVRSQLYIALDVGYLSDQQFESAQSLAEEVTRILAGLRTSIPAQIKRKN